MVAPSYCYQLYDFFLQNKDKLKDVSFLQSALQPHCKFNKLHMRGSRLRIIQLPLEIAQFLAFMAEHEVKSYLEIGTSTGGSWFLVDSYLRAAVPEYRGSIGYDRRSKLRDWTEYHSKFPTAEFRHQNSQNIDLKNEKYDMAFIDAMHIEKWVWHDFNKVKNNCRFVGFHDIVLGHGSTVSNFWNAAKQQYPHWEFIDRSLPETCGIGVLQVG